MGLEKAKLDINLFPDEIKNYLIGSEIYDSSCSQRSKTYFIDSDFGYYLKVAPKNTLEHESSMMNYFHGKKMTSRVCAYINNYNDNDYFLMERVKGESSYEEKFLKEPERLAVVAGESLRKLHDINPEDCPKKGITVKLIKSAHKNYMGNNYDAWFLDYGDFKSVENGYDFLCKNEHKLVEDVNLHGDACLPNIMLDDNFNFVGFIDFEGGGIGDRHFDIMWTIWSLQHNLETNDYMDRFLNAYGRDKFDMDRYKLCISLQAFTWED
ncbi:MAG: aminoglycoside 3'-phosphotransferase [Oscillospiraceae bacterium]|nr:aminoglycoside 3'-phosphotransferase [Oscillospiraceae bacterium]